MIGIIPKAYDDELIYSLLARVGVYNGFLNYRLLANELFLDVKKTPQIDFINQYKPQILQFIKKAYNSDTIEALIQTGTMFPYYTRFYDKSDRKKALDAIICGGAINDVIRINTGAERYLRYCPICAKMDRERYGETYWHRSHQLVGIDCCYIHGAILIPSVVSISGKASPNFLPAEIYADKETVEYDTKFHVETAKYNSRLLIEPVEDNTYISVIKNRLYEMRFISRRGAANHNQQIANYLNDKGLMNWKAWQVQKLLDGKRRMPHEISEFALAFGISVEDLLSSKASNFLIDDFDYEVSRMLKEKKGVKQIARLLGVSDGTVRKIRDGKTNHSARGTGGCKKKDWNAIDRQYLPLVIDFITSIKEKEDSGERPVKITAYLIAKELGLPYKSVTRLKKCADYIRQFEESQEEYWAREIEWAYHYINFNAEKMQYVSFRKLLNVRRSYMDAALPFICDNNIRNAVKSITKQE